jgi:hypothetical protein
MVDYISRAATGLVAPNGQRSLVISAVENVAFHYPGMASPINATDDAGMRRVMSALRGWQTYHMKTRGWSDIAYQVGIDQVGRAYTLRGVNVQSAANGDQDVNKRFGAILAIIGNNEAPSDALMATAREVVADFRKRYSRIPKRPTWHGAIRPGGTASDPSTSCPGKLTIAQIRAGNFDAGAVTTKPPVTPPATDDWEEIMALFGSKEEFETSVANGVYNGNYRYWRDFFKDGAGTGDAIWDGMRAFFTREAADDDSANALLKQIVDNTKPGTSA